MLCCSSVGKSVVAIREATNNPSDLPIDLLDVFNFPYSFDISGRCEMLDDTVGCLVYENRPDCCNIEIGHKKYGVNSSLDDYYRFNAQKCNELIINANLPKEYIVSEDY